MDEKDYLDRLSLIKNIIIAIFVVIFGRVIYYTVYKHDHFLELAENKTNKQLTVSAPRGEIRDKYGRLLAGNKNLFTVQVSGDGLKKVTEDGTAKENEISLSLMKILETNNEDYVDEFPIKIENGEFSYTYDENIVNFKLNNNIPEELDAEESFYYIVDKAISDGLLSSDDLELDKFDLQKKLHDNGIYPSILVTDWMFTDERNKNDWLSGYRIKDTNISAEDAFYTIRNSYKVDENISDLDARKIFVVRDLIKSQGFYQYNPVTIATDISEETMAQIEENAMDLLGVSVAVEPIRYYPEGEMAFHVLGYTGRIPYVQEQYYLSGEKVTDYATENGISGDILNKTYKKNDTVGRSGIEQSFEVDLKGIDGYKRVQVDALGRITKELNYVEPKAGDTVYLSLDMDLQRYTEKALQNVVETVKTGGLYQSPYGNFTVSRPAVNAGSGAVIAVDVKTGDVLSMASYPTFDPNKYTNGLSTEDYNLLQPSNPNDSLAPSAQMNLVTQGVFQPGSTFKMITGMAAIDNGLSPDYAIQDTGVIYLGDRPFADYIWHTSRSNHGYTNLYKAIQESCNIYFYTIGSGYSHGNGPDPDVKIDVEDILEYATKFGLNDKSGLDDEMYERSGKVPNIEDKAKGMKALLKQFIEKEMENAFEGISKSDSLYSEKIDTIVSWVDDETVPARGIVIQRLRDLGVIEDVVEYFADKILFDYLKFANWSTADTFNIAIGQGENQYNPAQIARFISAIANGGTLHELSTVDRIISNNYDSVRVDNNESEKIEFNNYDNLKELTKGMELATTDGTSRGAFANFPMDIPIATKTGTAERSGKIPTENEVEYLKTNMASYGVDIDDALALYQKLKKDREAELTENRIIEINELLESNDVDKDEKEELQKELDDVVKVELEDSDRVNAAYLRRAIKELNPSITDDKIDQYKDDYKSFSWSVGFAPSDDPEIAVVAVIPQGESSSNATLLLREVMGAYFIPELAFEEENSELENSNKNNDDINFISNIKK
ncbi:MAG: penicillin-binding transpeptidase domain-containing protein [Peptostreptococcaceae bacterium]